MQGVRLVTDERGMLTAGRPGTQRTDPAHGWGWGVWVGERLHVPSRSCGRRWMLRRCVQQHDSVQLPWLRRLGPVLQHV